MRVQVLRISDTHGLGLRINPLESSMVTLVQARFTFIHQPLSATLPMMISSVHFH
jgi:hypothetical protein